MNKNKTNKKKRKEHNKISIQFTSFPREFWELSTEPLERSLILVSVSLSVEDACLFEFSPNFCGSSTALVTSLMGFSPWVGVDRIDSGKCSLN